MPRTLRFHMDENVNPRIPAGLRRRGIDVTTTGDAALLHAPDEAHIDFARGESRVIFTQDADFLRLHAGGVEHSGIAYCPMGSRALGDIIRLLALMWEIVEPEEMRNRIEYF